MALQVRPGSLMRRGVGPGALTVLLKNLKKGRVRLGRLERGGRSQQLIAASVERVVNFLRLLRTAREARNARRC